MLFQMACRSASRLQEEFHFHSGELDHVVILERVRRGADLLAIDGGPVGPFHMRDEVALRPAGQHPDPQPPPSPRGETAWQRAVPFPPCFPQPPGCAPPAWPARR